MTDYPPQCYSTNYKSTDSDDNTDYGLRPRPNEYNISHNISCMKCCTRLATLVYRVVSCCMKFDRDQTFHWTNVARYNISFVFCDTVWCCTRLATPCNFVVLCRTRTWAVGAIFPPHTFVDQVWGNFLCKLRQLCSWNLRLWLSFFYCF